MNKKEFNTFVPDLRILCLKVVSSMANKYGLKVTERNPIKKHPRWPLIHLSKTDHAFVYAELNLDLPLRNALAYKADNHYWRRRVLREFPSLHSRSKGSVSPPNITSAGGREKKDHQNDVTGKKKSHPQVEIEVMPLPLVNFLTPNRSWVNTYMELLCSEKITSNSYEEVEEILKLGSSYINSLELSVPIRTNGNEKEDVLPPNSKKKKEVNLCEVLPFLTHLKRLSLQVKPKNNLALAPLCLNSATLLAESLTSRSLTSLSLYESGLEDEPAMAFILNLICIKSLKELDLRHNRLTSLMLEALVILARNINLEKIRLDHNLIRNATLLCKIISAKDTLKCLTLDLNLLDDEQCILLLSQLTQPNQHLEFLSLAGCRIEGLTTFWDNTLALLTEKKSQMSLQFLSLASNLFDEPPPISWTDQLNQVCQTRILVSSIKSSFQVRIPGHNCSSYMVPHYEELHSILRTYKEDRPPLMLPSLNQEVNHGLSVDDSTFKLESEIMNAFFHSKQWKEKLVSD